MVCTLPCLATVHPTHSAVICTLPNREPQTANHEPRTTNHEPRTTFLAWVFPETKDVQPCCLVVEHVLSNHDVALSEHGGRVEINAEIGMAWCGVVWCGV